MTTTPEGPALKRWPDSGESTDPSFYVDWYGQRSGDPESGPYVEIGLYRARLNWRAAQSQDPFESIERSIAILPSDFSQASSRGSRGSCPSTRRGWKKALRWNCPAAKPQAAAGCW